MQKETTIQTWGLQKIKSEAIRLIYKIQGDIKNMFEIMIVLYKTRDGAKKKV